MAVHHKFLRALPLAVCVLLCAAMPRAWAAAYSHAAATFNFIGTAGHTAITAWPGCGDTAGDDSLSAALNLGFTFNFGGVDYTQVRVQTNGRLQFNNTHCGFGTTAIGPPRTYTHLFPDANVNRTIRVYGADLDVSVNGGGTITFATSGTAPNRIFVVTWNNVSAWKAGGATNFGQGTAYNFQIQLHENGDFYFMYGVSDDVSEPANSAVGPAQIGWQLTTTDFVVVQSGLPANNSGLRFFMPSTIAEYRFDQGALTGTAGEVLDSSSNALHGTRINSPASKSPAQADPVGKVCQAVSIPANTSLSQIDAIDTGLPPTKVGSNGTVTFWYKSNGAWGGNDHLLFDATMSSGRDFYLARDNNGRLRFVVTDDNARRVRLVMASGLSVAAGTWKHIGVTWALAASSMRLEIYVDGVLVASTNDSSNGTLHRSLGSLFIGDNRSGNNELGGSTRSADGLIDEFRIYNFVGGQPLVARDMAISRSCATFDHFALSHAGSALTCETATVKLAAHLADHSGFSGYQGTVTVSTSNGRGDWSVVSGSGTLNNGTANDGSATYVFAAADGGAVALGLSNRTAETLNLNVSDGTATERSGTATAAEDADLTFASSGFAFLADGRSGAIGTQIAGKSSALAPGSQALALRAVRTSDSTGACEAALAGTQVIELAHECVNPTRCAGRTLAISGSAVAANDAGAVIAYTPLKLTFDATTGRAPFTLQYDDAGSVRLHARYNLPDASGAGTGQFMQGSSNAFVVRPFALDLTVTGNPGATTGSGARYVPAATPFNGRVRAVLWSAVDDTNNDGIADGHQGGDTNPANNAGLGDNVLAPNFTPGVAATVAARLQLPAGGNAPALAGTTSATPVNGVAAVNGMRYDEVGIVELSAAQSGDYLGIGATETAKIRGASGFVGRFYPARLAVTANTPVLGNACGLFTYVEQPFEFATAPVLTVSALNANGVVTRNYTASGFWKLATTLAGRTYVDQAGVAAGFSSQLLGVTALAGDSGLTGSATLSLVTGSGGDRFAYQRTTLVAPFDAKLEARFTAADLTDSDGVCYDDDRNGTCDPFAIAAIAGARLRLGRLATHNAFGSELTALAVPARTEFFDGSGFVGNADDTCTAVPTKFLDLGIDGVANAPAAGEPTVPLAGGSTTAAVAFAPVTAGELGFSFSPPGAGNTGDVDYRFDLSLASGAGAEWLRYDWDGDGAFDDDPGGRVSFGIFGGRAAVIYAREPW